MRITKAKVLTREQQDILRTARSVIRDQHYDYPEKELVESPHLICDKLSALLGERYSFRSGEVLEAPKGRK